MSNKKDDKLAKEIAQKAQRRRRDKQYEQMLKWRKGETTGLQCLEEIAKLEKIVFVTPEDMKPKSK